LKLLLAGILLLAAPTQARETYRANSGIMRMGGMLLFHHSQGPLSILPTTRKELPAGAVPAEEVFAKSCQHGLTIPLSAAIRATRISGAAGNGGYRKILERLHEKHPGLLGIYDVKVDIHIRTILGVYRRQCVEVSARGLRAPG